MRKLNLCLISLLILVVILTLTLNHHIPSLLESRFSDPQQTADLILSQGWAAIIVSLAIIIANTLVPFVPFIFLATANVLVFGLKLGFILAWTGAVAGAIVGYWIARLIGRDYFVTRFSNNKYVQTLGTSRHSFRTVFLARLLPIIPNSIVNYGAGISPIDFLTYLSATLLGKLPVVAWECLMGHDLINFRNNFPRLVILLIGTGAAMFGVWRLYPKGK